MKKMLMLLFLLFLLFSWLSAATTGKISGTVSDAETGEALPGVNVLIEGTNLGAATDLTGKFFIINIPPGSYSVKARFMGYSTKTITDVRVSIERTTTINIKMSPTVLSGDEVTVVAEREKIQRDVAYSQSALIAEEVTSAPTGTDIRATIDMAASIDRNEDTGNIIIRGSFADEVGLIIDDFASQDKRHGTPIFKISRASIKEIQILTGGFSPEYGQVRSGVINIVTKEGGDKYHGMLEYHFRPPGVRHVGPNVHSRANWWEKGRFTYMELREPGQMTVGGATYSGYRTVNNEGNTIFISGDQTYSKWDNFTNATRTNWRGETIPVYTNELGENVDANYDGTPDFKGWNTFYQELMANRRIKDFKGVPKTSLSPEDLMEAENWFLRPWEYDFTDHYMEVSVGGPVPFTSHKLSFHLDGYYDQQAFPTKVFKDNYIDYVAKLKLRYDITPSMNIRYYGNYGAMQSVAFGNYEANLDPRNTMNSESSVLRNSAGKNMFNWGSRQTAYYKWYASNGLRFTYIMSPETFWEINTQYNRNSYGLRWEMPLRDTNTPAYTFYTQKDSTPVFLSEAPYGRYRTFSGGAIPEGKWTDPTTGIEYPVWNVAPEMGSFHFGYQDENQDDSWYEEYSLKSDITSQLNQTHQIKAGVQFSYNLMHMHAGNRDGFIQTWGRQSWKPSSEHGSYSYLEGGLYVQDKIEFEGMIMNIGLRGDFFNANSPYFTEPWNYYYGSSAQFDENGKPIAGTFYSVAYDSMDFAPHEDGPLHFALAPRIGIAHPISEDAKIFFNYGYFYQKPGQNFLLLRRINPFWPLLEMNNPNLEFRKNINYEFGVEHNIADLFTYRVTGYYKDVYNEIGGVSYHPIAGTYLSGDTDAYTRWENNQYRDIRGVEFEVNGGFLRYFKTRLNYNYMLTRQGYYGFRDIFQDPFQDNQLQDPDASQPKPRPIFRAWLMLTTPQVHLGSSILNNLFSNLQVHTFFRWEAGEWFTYKRNSWSNKFPEEEQNVQWKPYHNGIDLQLYKGFNIGKLTLTAYLNVRNLLGIKQLFRQAFSGVRDPGFNMDDYMDYLEAKGKYEPGFYNEELEEILMRATPYYAIFQMPRTFIYGLQLEF
ncbi:TonB-dependent receptor [candidate division KSB1 bacterium]|nr:TonB-dependent receptor [candidate division KSB1 bacterium]